MEDEDAGKTAGENDEKILKMTPIPPPSQEVYSGKFY